MANDNSLPKPLSEQIFDELVKGLKDNVEFDLDLIQRLQELARQGELKS